MYGTQVPATVQGGAEQGRELTAQQPASMTDNSSLASSASAFQWLATSDRTFGIVHSAFNPLSSTALLPRRSCSSVGRAGARARQPLLTIPLFSRCRLVRAGKASPSGRPLMPVTWVPDRSSQPSCGCAKTCQLAPLTRVSLQAGRQAEWDKVSLSNTCQLLQLGSGSDLTLPLSKQIYLRPLSACQAGSQQAGQQAGRWTPGLT